MPDPASQSASASGEARAIGRRAGRHTLSRPAPERSAEPAVSKAEGAGSGGADRIIIRLPLRINAEFGRFLNKSAVEFGGNTQHPLHCTPRLAGARGRRYGV